MSRGGDEVKAAVDTSVRDAFLPGDVHLFLQELLILLIDVFLNGLPAEGWGEHRWHTPKDKTQSGPNPLTPISHSILPSLLNGQFCLGLPMDGFPWMVSKGSILPGDPASFPGECR